MNEPESIEVPVREVAANQDGRAGYEKTRDRERSPLALSDQLLKALPTNDHHSCVG